MIDMNRTHELVKSLIDNTKNGQLKWEKTSDPCMFSSAFLSRFFSVELRLEYGGYLYSLVEWDGNGDILTDLSKDSDSETDILVSQLFHAVIESNDEYLSVVSSAMSEWKEMCTRDPMAIGLSEIMKCLGQGNKDANPHYEIKTNSSFYYNNQSFPNYVAPPFVQLMTYEGFTPINEANVILVAAPGATGKSAMSSYLSNTLGIPLFDLGIHKAVGAHSLVGLLVDNLEMDDYVRFKNGLVNNRQSMIIDGLDEGEIKVNKGAFESFLDDVVNIAKDADGTPFIMLGRSRTVEDTIYYLESKGVSVACVQIEPFTIKKAELFIDCAISSQDAVKRYYSIYKQVQKYIIDSIHGFFEDDSALESQAYSRFIGYAPVLMAITSLLTERTDFNRLLNEFQEERRSNIDLVINIIEKILLREQSKIRDKALPPLLEKREEEFQSKVLESSATIEEQCTRVLYYILHQKYSMTLTDDSFFDNEYNDQMDRWIPNHPFLDANKCSFQNIVFESYVIARLACVEENMPAVLSYLQSSKSNSYLLFDFYTILAGNSCKVDYHILPFLFDSFRALDFSDDDSSMEIISTTEEDDFLYATCELTFSRKRSEKEIEFVSEIPYDGVIMLPSSVSGVTIDVPLNVCCSTPRLDFKPPVSINCHSFEIVSRDVVISLSKKGVGDVVINCDSFHARTSDNSIPVLVDRAGKKTLKIRTNSVVSYPFADYRLPFFDIESDDKDLMEKYNKLRRTIILFRSNGKETMARIKSKIHSRICNTSVGKAVVDKLINTGILVPDGIMYELNSSELDRQLGLSYGNIHSGYINDRVRAYLADIS